MRVCDPDAGAFALRRRGGASLCSRVLQSPRRPSHRTKPRPTRLPIPLAVSPTRPHGITRTGYQFGYCVRRSSRTDLSPRPGTGPLPGLGSSPSGAGGVIPPPARAPPSSGGPLPGSSPRRRWSREQRSRRRPGTSGRSPRRANRRLPGHLLVPA